MVRWGGRPTAATVRPSKEYHPPSVGTCALRARRQLPPQGGKQEEKRAGMVRGDGRAGNRIIRSRTLACWVAGSEAGHGERVVRGRRCRLAKIHKPRSL